jgi:hypothetical protein
MRRPRADYTRPDYLNIRGNGRLHFFSPATDPALGRRFLLAIEWAFEMTQTKSLAIFTSTCFLQASLNSTPSIEAECQSYSGNAKLINFMAVILPWGRFNLHDCYVFAER